MGLNDDNGEHLPIIGGTRSGKTTIQSAITRMARSRGVKVVEILTEGTRVSLDPVLPHPQTPTCGPVAGGYQFRSPGAAYVPAGFLRQPEFVFVFPDEHHDLAMRTLRHDEWLPTRAAGHTFVFGAVSRETESSGEDTQ